MPAPPHKPRLRKREIALAVALGALAAGAAAGILADGDGPSQPFIIANETGEKTYPLTGFERISSSGPQDVEVTYGESFSVRADGAIGTLDVVVENGELIIRPRNGIGGDWPGINATKLYVTMPRLTGVALNGTGNVSIDGIKGERFSGLVEGYAGDLTIEGLDVDQADFTIEGPGEIKAAGLARATRVTIRGPGELQAEELQSRTAAITVSGPGDVQLAVQDEAEVSVEGPGEVDITGPARCVISTSGPGSISCGGEETD